MIETQLPLDIMKQAVKGISSIAHPLRLRILEFLNIYGENSVSQNLQKLRDAGLVKTQRRNGRFIYYNITKGVHKTSLQCIHKRYKNIGKLS